VGAQLGTVLIRVGTTRPRSRLNRLILDGPGSLVRFRAAELAALTTTVTPLFAG